jgi:hypothetical protein
MTVLILYGTIWYCNILKYRFYNKRSIKIMKIINTKVLAPI